MNSVVLHPLARIEYRRAYKWYQNRSMVAAERFTAAVDETLDRIEQSPESGTAFRQHYLWKATKRFPFLLYYRQLSANLWIVLAIAHKKRRLGYWLRRQ